MGIHVTADVSKIRLHISGEQTYWTAPATIEFSKPFSIDAEWFPLMSAPLLQSVRLYRRSAEPIEKLLEDPWVARYMSVARAKGYDNGKRADLVCVRGVEASDDREGVLEVSVILSPEIFDVVNVHLERMQGRSAVLRFSCIYMGLRSKRYDEDVFPTPSEFLAGHPYLIRSNLEFELEAQAFVSS
ncbi:MAG: hypothetical protein L0H63_15600 [Nitrococcus sp.]|nr:hypothetical protein [Nitrococcus sp.]